MIKSKNPKCNNQQTYNKIKIMQINTLFILSKIPN